MDTARTMFGDEISPICCSTPPTRCIGCLGPSGADTALLDSAGGAVPSLALRLPPEPAPVPQQLSLHSPVGDLTISQDGGAIVAIDWGWVEVQSETPVLVEARQQLHDYFDGKRIAFDLALSPAGTAYQRRVWQALCDIPAGSTRTYADIARTVGGSPRAVGGANGRNPIPIVIPCHRVVATGGIGGYSGGDGLPTKRFLLALEGARPDGPSADDLFAPSDGA